MRNPISHYVSGLVVLGNILVAGFAAPPLSESVIPVTRVDGRPIVRGTLKGPQGTIPVNYVLALELARPLVLHSDIARMMELAHGQQAAVTIGDLQLAPLNLVTGDLTTMESLSKNFATELGNVSAVGYLGLPAFNYQVVELDLPAGVLRLRHASDVNHVPAGEASDVPAGAFRSAYGTEIFLDFTQNGDAYWLSGKGPDGALNIRLATGHAFSLIDRSVAARLGFPAGNLPELALRRLNLIEHIALRPENLGGDDPNGMAAVLGADLLNTFRLIIEPRRKQLRLLQVRPTQSPAAERAFYLIREKADADALEAWLGENASNRLAREAAFMLLNWRLKSDAPKLKKIQDALSSVAGALPRDRRAGELIRIADEFSSQANENAPAWAEAALKLAEQYADSDANGRAMYDIQARRGFLALKRGDLLEARRQLLSAMFGIPRDPHVNLWMGELYERLGKPVRSWSRYVQALLEDGGLTEAQRGLDRLHHTPEFRKQFRSEDAVQLLGGRIPAFHPPQQPHEAANSSTQSSGQLIEFFTNVDAPETAGAELALQGLAESAADEPVYVIQYHISTADNADPLTTTFGEYRAAHYLVDTPPVAIFNGKSILEANETDPFEVFEEYRFTLDLMDWTRSAPRITGTARLENETLSVTLQPEIPTEMQNLRMHAIVCAPAVLMPGANGVFLHHAVARYSLTTIDGLEITSAALNQPLVLTANQTAVQDELATRVGQIEQSHGISFHMRPTRVQFDDCFVIAFLQNDDTDEIMAATRITVAHQGAKP